MQKSGPWVCFYGGHSTGYKLGNHPKNIEPCAHRARTVRVPCAHRATTPPSPHFKPLLYPHLPSPPRVRGRACVCRVRRGAAAQGWRLPVPHLSERFCPPLCAQAGARQASRTARWPAFGRRHRRRRGPSDPCGSPSIKLFLPLFCPHIHKALASCRTLVSFVTACLVGSGRQTEAQDGIGAGLGDLCMFAAVH